MNLSEINEKIESKFHERFLIFVDMSSLLTNILHNIQQNADIKWENSYGEHRNSSLQEQHGAAILLAEKYHNEYDSIKENIEKESKENNYELLKQLNHKLHVKYTERFLAFANVVEIQNLVLENVQKQANIKWKNHNGNIKNDSLNEQLHATVIQCQTLQKEYKIFAQKKKHS